ncbi:MAG: hypothetical protein Q4G58_06070 [bacterium]|nr:hypothetical protein [bacterium]
MKKKKVIIGSMIGLVVLLFMITGTRIYVRYTPYSYHDGDVAKWQENLPSGQPYELALNKDGYPMYKEPFKALKQMRSDFSDSIALLKLNNNELFGLQIWNAHDYYGNSKVAFADGVDMENCSEAEKEQMGKLRSALEYFESSFVSR